jgi:hypothetical protein
MKKNLLTMIPEFQFVTEAPENAFLVCRMCLPDEETLALELATERKLEPGDVKVEYSFKGGQRYVSVYGRVVRVIDCHSNATWIADAIKCLRGKQAFDLLNATEADTAQIQREVRPYADWFRHSDDSERSRVHRFRLVGVPTSLP